MIVVHFKKSRTFVLIEDTFGLLTFGASVRLVMRAAGAGRAVLLIASVVGRI